MQAFTWRACELEMCTKKAYTNPFEDVNVDVIFKKGSISMRFPAFWDGGNIWRVRFSLPRAGQWEYSGTASDGNTDFEISGTVDCVPYEGDLEIYKHGFIKTVKNVRHFMYNDGTPFFYLGDTHWTFFAEEFDEAGDRAGDIKTNSHFKYIVDKRVEQGFTVYQSESGDANYNLSTGLRESDIEAFRDLDRRFAYIADKGLVHANAEIFFPNGSHGMVGLERYGDLEYLEKLTRYWVARYCAYPVLWTLGQEVDNDFYYSRGDQRRFTKENNPYIKMCEYLYKHDPFRHPTTAHMEGWELHAKPLEDGTSVSTSAFREVKGHTWYSLQATLSMCDPFNFEIGKDTMLNGNGKVAVLYEARYDHLATKNFGARMQGWLAFLNGLYGYGYGAIDIWFYNSSYYANVDSFDGVDRITPADKALPWGVSVNFPTGDQLGYMRQFFSKLAWWKLVPRFDSAAFFVPDGSYYSIATDERRVQVIYFYNATCATGTLNDLDLCTYTYQWFNPRENEYLNIVSFVPDIHRSFHLPQKPDRNDWVLLIKKK